MLSAFLDKKVFRIVVMQFLIRYFFVWIIVLVIGYALAEKIRRQGTITLTNSVNVIVLANPSGRDKFLWPFSSKSIWNMPIGSEAHFTPANLKTKRVSIDTEWFFKLKEGDPLRPVLLPGAWGKGRCLGTTFIGTSLPIPDNLIVPDATAKPYYTPNNPSAFLMPDRRTLIQLEPLARCTVGGNVYGHPYKEAIDIYGEGLGGAHFGSGLSSIGGSIRKGELTSKDPIRHALKINLYEKKYLYYSKSSPTPGYRWPATKTDSNASTKYEGNNPGLTMGTLLAIPPTLSQESLDLTTLPAKKLFHTMQDYGVYVVDSSGWDSHYISLERGADREFKLFYGYPFGGTRGKFFSDLRKIITVLSIVDNNSPTSGGGGGKPRAPLAPPISN